MQIGVMRHALGARRLLLRGQLGLLGPQQPAAVLGRQHEVADVAVAVAVAAAVAVAVAVAGACAIAVAVVVAVARAVAVAIVVAVAKAIAVAIAVAVARAVAVAVEVAIARAVTVAVVATIDAARGKRRRRRRGCARPEQSVTALLTPWACMPLRMDACPLGKPPRQGESTGKTQQPGTSRAAALSYARPGRRVLQALSCLTGSALITGCRALSKHMTLRRAS